MTYYYTYKITLLKGSLAGHYYFGRHTTDNLNDKYAGSGKILCDYYKHYGLIENVTYTKEILNFYNNGTELNIAEKDIISDKYKSDPFCINCRKGGTFGYISEEHYKRLSERMKKNNPMKNPEIVKKVSEKLKGRKPSQKSEEGKRILSERMKKNNPMKNPEIVKKVIEARKGKKLSEEHKQKISVALKGKQFSEEHKQKMSESSKKRLRDSKGKFIKNI